MSIIKGNKIYNVPQQTLYVPQDEVKMTKSSNVTNICIHIKTKDEDMAIKTSIYLK